MGARYHDAAGRWHANDRLAGRAYSMTLGLVGSAAIVVYAAALIFHEEIVRVIVPMLPSTIDAQTYYIALPFSPDPAAGARARTTEALPTKSTNGDRPVPVVDDPNLTTTKTLLPTKPPGTIVDNGGGSRLGDGNGSGNGNGGGNGTGDGGGGGTTRTVVPPTIPDDGEVSFVEEEPVFDYDILRRSVVYPELARRNGVEGTVVVKVYVDEQGHVRDVRVHQSDHALLNEAALRGVRAVTFKPGRQNGQVVGCWLYIPVRFTL